MALLLSQFARSLNSLGKSLKYQNLNHFYILSSSRVIIKNFRQEEMTMLFTMAMQDMIKGKDFGEQFCSSFGTIMIDAFDLYDFEAGSMFIRELQKSCNCATEAIFNLSKYLKI